MADSRARNRDFVILFMVMLTTGAGNTALQSVLPAIGRTLKVPDILTAAVFSVSAFIWVFTAPFWAGRSDRQGRRNMVLLGSGGFTASVLLVGIILFAGLQGWIAPVLAIGLTIFARMIFGIFGSAAPPAAQAMIVLKTPLDQRVKALSLLSSAFGLGTILGLALAPWMVLPVVDLAGPAFVFALLGATLMFFIWRYLQDDEAGDPNEARGANVSYPSIGGAPAGATVTAVTADRNNSDLKLTDKRIWHWMVSGLVTGHAQAMTGSLMGFLVLDRLGLAPHAQETQQYIGLVLMSGAGAALLVQWGVIPLLNMSPRMMMAVGLVLSALGLAGTAFASSLFALATSYALSSMGFGFTRPAFTAGSSLAVDRSLQGIVAGRVTSVNGASFVIAPALGVALYKGWEPLPFVLAAAVSVLMIPWVLAKLNPSPHGETPSPVQ
jgi:MFS family permease